MKKLLIKKFGQDCFCRMFHTGREIDKNTWYCSICNKVVNKSKLDKRL